jgi:hypothetical protein
VFSISLTTSRDTEIDLKGVQPTPTFTQNLQTNVSKIHDFRPKMTELVVFSCYLEEGRSFMGFSKYLDPPL